MFPHLGPPIGFLIATGLFLLLLVGFGEAAFVDWAWRVPFLLSAVLVAIGPYVSGSLAETPAFKENEKERRGAGPQGERARACGRHSSGRHPARTSGPADPKGGRDRRLLRTLLYRDRLY